MSDPTAANALPNNAATATVPDEQLPANHPNNIRDTEAEVIFAIAALHYGPGDHVELGHLFPKDNNAHLGARHTFKVLVNNFCLIKERRLSADHVEYQLTQELFGAFEHWRRKVGKDGRLNDDKIQEFDLFCGK